MSLLDFLKRNSGILIHSLDVRVYHPQFASKMIPWIYCWWLELSMQSITQNIRQPLADMGGTLIWKILSTLSMSQLPIGGVFSCSHEWSVSVLKTKNFAKVKSLQPMVFGYQAAANIGYGSKFSFLFSYPVKVGMIFKMVGLSTGTAAKL